MVGAALLTLHPGFARLWDERGRRLLQALHCWVWPNLLFWSVVPGHHFRHGLPLQPGLAGLAAMTWIAWLTGRWRWPLPRLKPACAFVGLLAAWLAVKVAYVQVVVPHREGGGRRGRRRRESPRWCRTATFCICAISKTRESSFTTAGRRGGWAVSAIWPRWEGQCIAS